MPDFLKTPFANAIEVSPLDILIRLLAALALGGIVALIYRRTRARADITPSFPITLVLLSLLIAMVTQVIGDNIARAFSLVGALSIVRFRTVVRDTQDTAYVIFAVVVGMAVGARDLWVGIIGIAVVALAAFLMRTRASNPGGSDPTFLLSIRVVIGLDFEKALGTTIDAHLEKRHMISLVTAKQGSSLDIAYEALLRPTQSAEELVKSLMRIEGVQSVELQRRGFDSD